MKTKTLAELRLEAKQRCDQVNSNYISDQEWNTMINRSCDKFRNEMVQIFGADYYVTQQAFTVVEDQKTYPLPDNFFKFQGIDLDSGNGKRNLYRFDWVDRNQDTESYLTGLYDSRYRIVGNEIIFTSVPRANFSIWYSPTHTDLSADEDTVDGISGFDELIVVDCARKAAVKEESFEQSQHFAAEFQDLVMRLREGARTRDANEPFRIQRKRNRRRNNSVLPGRRGLY